MIYVICKAKNEIASNEQIVKYNPENWEIIETVKCRKNASYDARNNIFSPIYQRLSKEQPTHIRLWDFTEEEIKIK